MTPDRVIELAGAITALLTTLVVVIVKVQAVLNTVQDLVRMSIKHTLTLNRHTETLDTHTQQLNKIISNGNGHETNH